MEFDASHRQAKPAHCSEILQQAQQLCEAGNAAQAIDLCRKVLALDCAHPQAWALLGAASLSLQHWDNAVDHLSKAQRLAPTDLAVLGNLGIALAQAGRLEESIAVFEKAVEIGPNHYASFDHLATALAQARRFDEAIERFQTACRLAPVNGEAHFKLGVALEKRGRYAEAVESFCQAHRRLPARADIERNMALSLAETGRCDEAATILENALKRHPHFAEGFNALGIVLQKQGRFEEAAAAFVQAIAIRPDYARAFGNLRNTYRQLGRIDDAVAHCRRTIERHSANAVSYNSLGTLLLVQDKLDEAEAAFREALRLRPDDAIAMCNLGHTCRVPGRLDEALEYYRKTIALEPKDPYAHSNLIYVMHFHPAYGTRELGEEAARWRARHADPLKQFIRPHAPSADRQRRLKVGYVSPNFYRQAECFFVVPLVEHHDHEKFEIHCYASVARPDAVTTRMKHAADVWHDVARMSNEALAEKIRGDGIDILVDLTMHMGNKRLTLFALKPSPVQVTWLAYPGTTGLDTIDYRFTDAHMEPADTDETWSSEIPLRLPDCWCCYEPIGEFPSVSPLPALEKGYVTFGSLNTPMKHQEGLLRLWANVLAQVPDSRLQLLGAEGAWRETVLSVFVAEGVDGRRIEFTPACPWTDYMKLYHAIDVCLDPLPYNGITTTCDALWMGVPVVSLLGRTPAGRAGLGLLRTIGLPELVAASDAEFMRIAASLANDLQGLAKLRSSLRLQMQASPLMDGARFARHVESAYRSMWLRWCEGQTPSKLVL